MGYKKYIIALLFISVLGWGLTRARCRKRGAGFNARVEEIKNKAPAIFPKIPAEHRLPVLRHKLAKVLAT